MLPETTLAMKKDQLLSTIREIAELYYQSGKVDGYREGVENVRRMEESPVEHNRLGQPEVVAIHEAPDVGVEEIK
jgi:hypothetical protein